ncbi:adenylate/guanylate cyclase domain-containing protein [Mesorhizobium sp. YM1C-6-2]|uniref:adenylate/guanylate cyclase domain-containing protein n=1 Tax=Mesorhizobium sp. YM1C-6-2 TaxID=1827501 RepID=UPI000EF17E25|nr:adenylate/guanylate cyclase domain-containing protein [Mesorhizobium sp. YM1C-6-2]RLP27819.1 adenylate/guanylate cyclase domain-containing protein [Mesorhizobium sp. YM1C-6-2]
MDEAEIAGIADWVVRRGLSGDDEVALLHGFCERCVGAGLAISRGIAIIDTLHPVYEGRVFYWSGDKPLETVMSQYEPTTGGQETATWLSSPFYHLLQSREGEMRRRLHLGETAVFPVLEELRQEGQTDWLALVQHFDKEAAIGEMDCFMSRWTTTREGGFSDAEIAALRRLVPMLGLAIKSVSLTRVAQSLVEAYLGRDAGRRVLKGLVTRGAVERLNAVVWFSDMQGYTSLSERISSDELIPLLNDYAEVAIMAVHGAGGDVLKLMADGVLAIFTADDPAEACAAALAAEAGLRLKLASLNERRTAAGQPVSSIYLGLHIGDVFYGNIGSKERLDFTVVGQAVNEASRIASMCRSADRDVLFSSDFRASLPEAERDRLVSVGRYALRGVSRPQELFTLDPEAAEIL